MIYTLQINTQTFFLIIYVKIKSDDSKEIIFQLNSIRKSPRAPSLCVCAVFHSPKPLKQVTCIAFMISKLIQSVLCVDCNVPADLSKLSSYFHNTQGTNPKKFILISTRVSCQHLPRSNGLTHEREISFQCRILNKKLRNNSVML